MTKSRVSAKRNWKTDHDYLSLKKIWETAQDIRDFHAVYTEIHQRLGRHLGKCEISTRIQVTQFPRHYLINKARPKVNPRFAVFRSGSAAPPVSAEDRQILKVISSRARATLDEIAEAVSLTPATVKRRLENLEKNGTVQGYTAVVHPERLGYQLYKLLIRTSSKTPDTDQSLFRYAQENVRVIFFSRVVAPWDFEVTVEVLDHEDLQNIISELREHFHQIISEIEIVITFDHFLKYRLLVDE